MKRLIAFLATILLFVVNSFGAYIPIPMPVYSGGGGCHMSNKQGLSLWIAFNILIVFCWFIRFIIWIIKYSDETSVFRYVFYDDEGDNITCSILSISFISVNGLCLLIILAMYIHKI